MYIAARTYAEGKRAHYSRITPQRLAFVNRFVANGGRGTAAAVAAGFAESSAGVSSVQLLKDDRILALIAAEVCRRPNDAMAQQAAARLLRPTRPQWLRVKFQLLLAKGGKSVKLIGTPERPATIANPSDQAERDHLAKHAAEFGLGDGNRCWPDPFGELPQQSQEHTGAMHRLPDAADNEK